MNRIKNKKRYRQLVQVFLSFLLLSCFCLQVSAENGDQEGEPENNVNENNPDENQQGENNTDEELSTEEQIEIILEQISPDEDAALVTSLLTLNNSENQEENNNDTSDFTELENQDENSSNGTEGSGETNEGNQEQNNEEVVISDKDRIHFLRVGSSDCILIESNGKFGLVDTSNPSNSEYGFNDPEYNGTAVATYLKFLGVKHLEFIEGSHSHSDHIGGIPEICEAVNEEGNPYVDNNTTYIYKFYENINKEEEEELWKNRNFYYDALDAMDFREAKKVYTNDIRGNSKQTFKILGEINSPDSMGTYFKGDSDGTSCVQFPFGDMTIRIYNLGKVSLDDENTNSLITLVICGDKKVLLMADMNVRGETEQKIVKKITDEYGKIDVYKVGHHGYYFSTSYDTIKMTDPTDVIISNSSVGNSQSLYQYYKEHNKNVYCTGDGRFAIVADLTDGISIKTYNDANELSVTPSQWVPTQINTGWQRIAKNENQYDYIYVKDDFSLTKGWKDIDGYNWYYFNADGIMLRGKQVIDGVEYEFEDSGLLIDLSTLPKEYQKKGWFKDQDKWYYGKSDGNLAKGWLEYNKNWYYFNDKYVMVTGWKEISGKWYYFDEDGVMQTGWLKLDDKTYYMDSSGVMVKGWQLIDKKYYYFKSNGVMQTGWLKSNNNWYYMDQSGVMQTGWQRINNKYYYFKNSGAMATGSITLEGKKYNFDSNGALINEKDLPLKYKAEGWEEKSGNWYYIKANHTYAVGWLKVKGVWYYFNENGIMQTGWKKIDGKWYYLKGSGAMQTGWLKSGKSWYYLKSSGAMATGWYKDNNTWYYSNSSGIMQNGWLKDGGKWYYLKGSGAMQKGWLKSGGSWYYLKSSGAMATGWYKAGDVWYYANSSGVMQTGWLQEGNSRYYLQPDGVMAIGTIEIDGETYTFDENGKLMQ